MRLVRSALLRVDDLRLSTVAKTLLGRGRLLLVNNEIDQTTGTLQLKAVFPNKQSRLWPGQLVNARLLLETLPHGLTVPAPAVQQGPNGAYVYVIEPNGTVAIRPVTVAQIGNLRAVMEQGGWRDVRFSHASLTENVFPMDSSAQRRL